MAAVSSPDYSSIYSSNPLTQGANKGEALGSQNASQTALAQSDSRNAQPTNLSTPIGVTKFNVEYTNARPSQYPLMVQKYGVEVANRLASQQYENRNLSGVATNTDNQYLPSENRAITNAQERQTKFVDNNLFRANPYVSASAPIPDEGLGFHK